MSGEVATTDGRHMTRVGTREFPSASTVTLNTILKQAYVKMAQDLQSRPMIFLDLYGKRK